MSFRFALPHAYDPNMNREDLLTLSRTTSHSYQNGATSQAKSNGNANGNANGNGGTPAGRKSDHAKQPYVFADPVAFRHENSSPLDPIPGY